MVPQPSPPAPGQTPAISPPKVETAPSAPTAPAAAVALLLPENSNDYGYISEYHGYGKKLDEVEDWVCDQAAELYASAKGFKINWRRAWSEEESFLSG